MIKKKPVQIAAVIVVCCLLAAFIELMLYHRLELFNDKIDEFVSVSEASMEEKNGSVVYTMNAPASHVSMTMLQYEATEDFDYNINVGGEDVGDHAHDELSRAAMKVSFTGGQVILTVPKSDHITIQGVRFVNRVAFVWHRFFFMLFMLLMIAFAVFVKVDYAKNLHLVFALFATVMGLFFLSKTFVTVCGWDEQIHFYNSYWYSYATKIAETDAVIAYRDLEDVTSDCDNWQTAKDWSTYYKENHVVSYTQKPLLPTITDIAYLPSTAGLFLARLFHLPFFAQYMVGKLFNLIFYVLIVAIAIKKCTRTANLIMVVGLLPTNLFSAANYQRDPFIVAFLLLGLGMMVEAYLSAEPITTKRGAWSLVWIAVGALSKAIYFPLILLWLFVPKYRYISDKARKRIRIAAIVLFLLGMATFALPFVTSTSNYSDVRGGDTDAIGQVLYILHEPLRYTRLLLGSIYENAVWDFCNGHSYSSFAYIGTANGIYNEVMQVLLLFAAVVVPSCVIAEKGEIRIWYRIASVVLSFGICCLIWTALYISFTSYMANEINGVQPRYFIPLLFPLCSALYTNKVQFNWDVQKTSKWMILFMVLACGMSIFDIFFL